MIKKTKAGSYSDFFEQVVSDLPKRSQDVLRRRFGIDPSEPQTLDSIGKKYGLTRERIRQIVESGVADVKVTTSQDIAEKIYAPLEREIQKRGNIMLEEELVETVAHDNASERGAVRFFLETAERINYLKRRDVLKAVVHVEFDEKQWERVRDVVKAILADVKEPLAHDILHEQYKKHRDAVAGIDEDTLHHYLQPVVDVQKNPFGRWGMAHWRDVTPRGIREKIYLVLKEYGEPMHFKKIAERIDAYKLNKRPGVKTNVQTVHNELIKDHRFILVGRGLYGLDEWGYTPGTVRDVITTVLKAHGGGPMRTDEIVQEVLNVRDVRRMTIIVNLNQFFKKVSRGVYALPDDGEAKKTLRVQRKTVTRKRAKRS